MDKDRCQRPSLGNLTKHRNLGAAHTRTQRVGKGTGVQKTALEGGPGAAAGRSPLKVQQLRSGPGGWEPQGN